MSKKYVFKSLQPNWWRRDHDIKIFDTRMKKREVPVKEQQEALNTLIQMAINNGMDIDKRSDDPVSTKQIIEKVKDFL